MLNCQQMQIPWMVTMVTVGRDRSLFIFQPNKMMLAEWITVFCLDYIYPMCASRIYMYKISIQTI